MKLNIVEDPRKLLETLSEPGELWLCCNSCDRFFQLKDGQEGEWVRCPFHDCNDHGLGLGLFPWDTWQVPEDPRWPRSPEDLVRGQRAPDPEPFVQSQLQLRIDKLVGAFDGSQEHNEIGAQPSRYLRPFIQMTSDLCADLTEDDACDFSEDVALMVEDLPVWSQTAAPAEALRMAEELLAFFRYAVRTEAVPHAECWLQFLLSIDLVERLRFTMQNDRRLQAQQPTSKRKRCSRSKSRGKSKRKQKRRR